MAWCQAIKKDGHPCKLQAMKDQSFCYYHSQDKAVKEARYKASQQGGTLAGITKAKNKKQGALKKALKAAKHIVDPLAIEKYKKYSTPEQVIDLISRTIHAVLTNIIDEKQGQTVLNATTPLLKAIEQQRVSSEVVELRVEVTRILHVMRTSKRLTPIFPPQLLQTLDDYVKEPEKGVPLGRPLQ